MNETTNQRKFLRNVRQSVLVTLVLLLLCGLVFTGYNYYQDYTAASATVSVVYPEIADGTYPDGSRFTIGINETSVFYQGTSHALKMEDFPFNAVEGVLFR